jgi:hypothetical protein
MADFQIECFQNEYLPQGAQTMHAVLTVTASGTTGAATNGVGTQERCEVLIVDTSGSMNGPKLRSVKEATAAAIDCIPDGVRFGIITGNHKAEVAFPPTPPLAVSSPQTRTEAKLAVKKFEARGGTAIGTWIDLARLVVADASGIRHAILLTDGKNESEDPADLERVLGLAEGVIQCDCRGVGADWEVAELRKVASSLLGSLDIVAQPEGLVADFTAMMKQSLSKRLAEVSLRVWNPQGAELLVLKQMEPPIDLTAMRVQSGPLSGDYATGAWGDECRDFHLTVRVPPGEIDDEMLVARVTLMLGDEASSQALVRAIWTDDTARSTRINRQVAEALGDAELADAIQEGIDALRDGDDSTATDRLGRAVQLADEADNEEVIDRLSKLVVIEDRSTGRVQPKRKIDDIDMMLAEARSTRSSSAKNRSEPHGFTGTDPMRCATCGLRQEAAIHQGGDTG